MSEPSSSQQLTLCDAANVHQILEAFLKQQRDTGFTDLAGTRLAATIPVADRLLNELIARLLPPDGVVREVVLHSREGNEIAARVRVAKGGMKLPISLMFEIESQPVLPQRPVLGLRLKSAPRLLALGGGVLRMFDMLPPGITVDGDRIYINLEALLRPYDTAQLFRYLTELSVTTSVGVVVFNLRAGIEPGRE